MNSHAWVGRSFSLTVPNIRNDLGELYSLSRYLNGHFSGRSKLILSAFEGLSSETVKLVPSRTTGVLEEHIINSRVHAGSWDIFSSLVFPKLFNP